MKKTYFFLVFLVLISITYILLNYEKNLKVKQHLDQKTKQYEQAYNVVYGEYKSLSTVVFQTKIDTNEVKKIFKDAKDASVSEKNSIRKKLFENLKETYSLLETYNIRQLHFHLPNNESFLRFHRPTKYGDNLAAIRPTVKYVNETKKPIDGFEEGRIYNGYRFVFPLFYENGYIGSVEISFSTLIMTTKLMKNFDVSGEFLISKDVVMQKVFNSEKSNYQQSDFENFVYEIKTNEIIKKYGNPKYKMESSNKTKKIVKQRAFEENSFSLYDDKSNNIMTFIKVFNPITKKVIGIQLIRSDSDYINNKTNNFYFIFFIISFTILISVIFVYRTMNERKTLDGIIKNLEQFIDTQDNIVILSDGNNVTFSNKKFCEFLGFDSLKSFHKKHESICELCIKNDKFFHLGKVKNHKNWIEAIGNLPRAKRLVSIKGSDFKIHAFSLSVNQFNKKLYIVTFTDISDSMKEKLQLENKLIKDKLTGALNREFFDKNYKKIINEYHRNDTKLAVALLDIDHFKSTNDIYGHSVGDEVLKQFVNTLQKFSRDSDILIRWGGEEFVLLLKVKSENALKKTLEHLRQVIENTSFSTVGKITCSIGGTIYKDGEHITESVKRADEAMYDAKIGGRNMVLIK